MPNLNGTRELLETTFVDGWDNATPIALENLPFDETDVENYVQLKLINYRSENVTIGAATNKRKRHTGVLSVKIHVKIDTGIKAAYDFADAIADFMDNINLSNLFTHSTDVRRGGKTDSGYYTVIADVPYFSDE